MSPIHSRILGTPMLNHKPCIEDDQTSGEFSVLPTWLPAKARSSPKDLAGCEQFWLQLMQKGYEVHPRYEPRILGRFEG